MNEKDNDKSFENLPACAAEFITLVIKKMRYRSKVRHEVMTELIGHFEDELKDCKSDDEKNQRVEKLINEFGDAKVLAVLLRRAKKRCRPLWRTIVARTFQTVGVLIVCLIVYAGWFFTGRPKITTNYLAHSNRLARPVADESLNAGLIYAQAAKVFEKLPDKPSKLLRKKYTEITDEEKDLIRQVLKDNQDTLQMVIAGTEKPYYWQKYGSDGDANELITVLMPNLADYRQITWALGWRAWLSAEDGRFESAFADLISCYRFGQHLRGDKSLIEQLVGIAIEALSLQATRDILSRYEVEPSALAKLQSDLENVISAGDFGISLKLERLLIYDELQRFFTDDRLGGGHLYLPRLRYLSRMDPPFISGKDADFLDEAAQMAHILFTHPNKSQTSRSIMQLYDYCERLAAKSAAQVHSEKESLDTRIQRLATKNIFIGTFVTDIGRIITISQRSPTEVNANLVIISALRYKQQRGDYPGTLEELTAGGYLKELPMDSFSDKPLVYRKTDDGFMLYSVGQNFIDDGGQYGKDKTGEVKLWADDGDAVFWPAAQ
ncbi:MAG TPA: hypothetical protein VMW23_10400 [Sedimentisphaerales bacterium]|nr:hypothetical protein [Sedimentisphaerales bacterium]